ncbi:MAG: AAA family ATPase, partial [Planctomycetota bacterium]
DKDSPPAAKTSRAPFFEKEGGGGGKPRFVARVERQGHPRYFEPNRPRTLLSELSDPVYHPHVVAAAREISSWRVYYVEPARMRERIGVQSAEEPGRSGELLAAYYYTLQERSPGTLRAIVRNLRDLVPGLEDLRVDVREGSLEIVTTHVGGAEYPARLLSEGTLRLLCLLGIAVAPSPPAVVVYEEPENGVNPARLDLLADVIRSAVEVRPDPIQFVLTTHSPLVCNLFPQHLVLCSWSPKEGTALRPFPWNREALYFQDEVVRGLDGVSTLPGSGGSLRVAESQAPP